MKKYGKISAIAAGILIIGGIIFCQFVYGHKKISAEEIKEQFPYEEGNLVPVYNLAQEQKVILDFEMDYQYMYDELNGHDLVTIHTDASCSKESEIICYAWDMEWNGKIRLYISPVDPVLKNDSLKEEDDKRFYYNRQAESPADYKTLWGCAPIYYICIHYDTEEASPVRLENPQIIPFTVASESEVPDVEGIIDNYGNLTLSWKPVEGAEYYTVYQYVPRDHWYGYNNEANKGMETGYRDGSFWSVGKTEDTCFSDLAGEEGEEDEEEQIDLSDDAGYIGTSLSCQSYQNLGTYGCFFVTATVEGKESNLSAPIDTADLKLPYKFAYDTINYKWFDNIEELPEKLAVLNIDGSIMQRPVYYRLRKKTSVSIFYDFQVKGTLLGGTVCVNADDITDPPAVINQNVNMIYLNANAQLNKVPSMAVKSILAQEGTAGVGSNLYEAVKEGTEQWIKEGDKEKVKKPDERLAVFADSAEEAWLAYGLMAGNEEISLKAFPKLQNPYTLEAVFLKVCQQNPYILGVRSYSYDYDNACLKVGYSYGKWEISRKQKKIYKCAQKLVEELIWEGMTDEEKEMQIYLWLEENCSYATVEWEQAKKQNFLKSEGDIYMENAVNAYGALVDREALCQGYASAFQLLSHMSGLHVKTVSGYLNGNIPHAWNLVELKENWYQIDCSSNRNTVGVPFYLYNGDLEFAEENGYVMGNDFVLNEERELLEEKNRDYFKEYYYYHDLTADSMEEVEKILAEKVHEEVIAFRYTDYDFDETAMIRMVRKIFLMNGEDERLDSLQYSRINDYVVIYGKDWQK